MGGPYFSIIVLCLSLFPIPTLSAECWSSVPEADRLDCAPGMSDITEGICRSMNCVWCVSSQTGIPHCFYDVNPSNVHRGFLHLQCDSCGYCPYAKDCHPDPGATPEKCHARGCQWCSYPDDISCGPMCMYAKSNDLTYTRLSCQSCGSCSPRLDCHPETGADAGKCLSRGCRWCPDAGDTSKPTCVHSYIMNLVTEARLGCNTCSDCKARVDCHPETGGTSEACIKRNCIWCPTDEPGQPYCVYGGSTTPYQNWCNKCDDCNTKIACPPGIENPTQLQCEWYGCLWCAYKSFGEPKCVHKLC